MIKNTIKYSWAIATNKYVLMTGAFLAASSVIAAPVAVANQITVAAATASSTGNIVGPAFQMAASPFTAGTPVLWNNITAAVTGVPTAAAMAPGTEVITSLPTPAATNAAAWSAAPAGTSLPDFALGTAA